MEIENYSSDLERPVGRRVIATARVSTGPLSGAKGQNSRNRFGNLTYSEIASNYGRTVAFGRESKNAYDESRFIDPVKDRPEPKRFAPDKVAANRERRIEKALCELRRLPATFAANYLEKLPSDLATEVRSRIAS